MSSIRTALQPKSLLAPWSPTTIGALVDEAKGFVHTGPFGSQLHASDYVPDGTPVVMPQQLGDNSVTTDGIARILEKDRDRLSRHVMKKGDIVFSRRGDVTRRAFITDKETGWLCGTGCLLVRINHPECDNRFLARYLSLPSSKTYLEQHAVGATMPNLNQGILRSVPVRLPPINTQRIIVDVLSAYDDLIANNTRRIKLLEDAARLLYEEWFVRLRFPGYEHTQMQNRVPKGWEETTVFEAVNVLSGGTPRTTTNEYWGDEIPFYTPKDSSAHIYVLDTEKHLTESGLKNCSSQLYPKDTLFITARGTVGKLNLAQNAMAMNQSCYALVAKNQLSQQFLYLSMNSAVEHFKAQAAGAVFDAIIRDTFKRIKFLVPEARLVQTFDEQVAPMFAQVENLLLQNCRLQEARDLLLPRLMSGEVAV